MNTTFEYVGSELEVFAQAINWKGYFGSQLRRHIRGKVLEVGAGLGATTRVLCNEQIACWTCLEPDRDLAEKLADTIQEDPFLRARPIDVMVGTLDDVANDNLFDTILYIDVLEHIEHDHLELAQAARLLARGGRLVVLSPAHQWLFSPFDDAIGHYRRYSRKTLQAVGPAGLDLIALRYLDSAGLLASLANRTILKSSKPTAKQIAFWDSTLVPASRFLDPVFGYRLGKSVFAAWRR